MGGGGQPTFQEWLNTKHEQLRIVVREHPTYDYCPISYERLTAIEADIRRPISVCRTVVVVDSGWESRTGKVC